MLKLFRRVQQQVALPPGTLVFAGKQKMERAKISVTAYNVEDLQELNDVSLEHALATRGHGRTAWINVDGLHETDKLKRLGEELNIHPLVLEDIVNVSQRAKVEEYDDYIYIVAKMIRYDTADDKIHSEQISIILGDERINRSILLRTNLRIQITRRRNRFLVQHTRRKVRVADRPDTQSEPLKGNAQRASRIAHFTRQAC